MTGNIDQVNVRRCHDSHAKTAAIASGTDQAAAANASQPVSQRQQPTLLSILIERLQAKCYYVQHLKDLRRKQIQSINIEIHSQLKRKHNHTQQVDATGVRQVSLKRKAHHNSSDIITTYEIYREIRFISGYPG